MASNGIAAPTKNDDPPPDDDEIRSVDDKTESEYEHEAEGDYKVLQTQIVDTGEPTLVGESAQQGGDHGQQGVDAAADNDWSPRTSFTADSPYFDAFCDGEIGSLNMLSDTLGDISHKARIFVKAGAMMSEATRRLAMACKLRRDASEENLDESSGLTEEEMIKQRRGAVGEEMASILELLGEVRLMMVLFGVALDLCGLL